MAKIKLASLGVWGVWEQCREKACAKGHLTAERTKINLGLARFRHEGCEMETNIHCRLI